MPFLKKLLQIHYKSEFYERKSLLNMSNGNLTGSTQLLNAD